MRYQYYCNLTEEVILGKGNFLKNKIKIKCWQIEYYYFISPKIFPLRLSTYYLRLFTNSKLQEINFVTQGYT